MFRYALTALLGLVIVASAQPFLTPEEDFFGIPGVDSLSTPWFLAMTDSTYGGSAHPGDVEVLKLSPCDYRLVILGAFNDIFVTFRIDQQSGVPAGGVVHSGAMEDTLIYDAAAMCQIRHGTYFDPQTDRVAVAFWGGGTVGVFQFNSVTGEFVLERTFTNPAIAKPVGIYWAIDQFFIVDETTQSIFRTDSSGNIISHYGREGLWIDGYYWISDIDGYVDGSGTAHLYVCDGSNMRVDHLTATASDTAIHLHSQVWAAEQDTGEYNTHEVALLPGVGVAGFDRFVRRFYVWDRSDSLQAATRSFLDWPLPDSPPVHMRQACGRLVVAYVVDSVGWVLRSYQVSGAVFDDPQPLPPEHWTIDMSPVVLSGIYHVAEDEELWIDAGVQVLFDQSAALVVDYHGRLLANGTGKDPVTFASQKVGDTWSGVTVEGGSLYMEYVNMFDADSFCVFAKAPSGAYYPVHLRHCYFDGRKMSPETWNSAIMVWDAPKDRIIIDSCRIDSANGRGIDLRSCIVFMTGDTIQDCALSPGYLFNVTGEIVGCRFAGRAQEHGLLLDGTVCDPFLRCCEFENLAPQNVMEPNEDFFYATIGTIKGTSPVFGWGYSDDHITNVISDSSATLLWMFEDGALPVVCRDGIGSRDGRNDWYQQNEQGVYITWFAHGSAYKAHEQFWNRDPQVTDFYPAITGLFVFDPHEESPYGLCGEKPQYSVRPDPRNRGRESNVDDLPEDVELFEQGLTSEASGDYAAAHGMFLQLVRRTADYNLRWQSVAHVLSTLRRLPNIGDSSVVVPLVDSLITASGNLYKVRVHGNRVLVGYHLDRRAFDQAISICTGLLQTELTTFDSLLVAMDLVNAQLLWESSSGRETTDDAVLENIPAAFRVRSRAQGLRLHSQLLNALGQHPGTEAGALPIPKSYKLYQNYPNPFNPNTEIRFDLPEAVNVQIKIYNTLGQEVATLIDETRPAGSYRMIWDSKSASGVQVASGVYIYQIKAGDFVDSKKMVLIR